jgi:hypothetical protein
MEVTKKRIDQIKRRRRYGLIIDGETFRGEPTQDEVAAAVDKKELETRGLQEHWVELLEEWKRVPRLELPRLLREYHARRIAFFWFNGWADEDGIKICAHDVLEDGAHRFLSAKYKTEPSVDCVIVKCNKCLKG